MVSFTWPQPRCSFQTLKRRVRIFLAWIIAGNLVPRSLLSLHCLQYFPSHLAFENRFRVWTLDQFNIGPLDYHYTTNGEVIFYIWLFRLWAGYQRDASGIMQTPANVKMSSLWSELWQHFNKILLLPFQMCCKNASPPVILKGELINPNYCNALTLSSKLNYRVLFSLKIRKKMQCNSVNYCFRIRSYYLFTR